MNDIEHKLAEGVLFTDLYQLTMAQVYFRQGLHERPAQFEYFFRSYPNYDSHRAGYCVNAGLEWLLDWMQANAFTQPDIEALRSQRTRTGRQLFDDDFLAWLGGRSMLDTISLRAIPEGRIVHPYVPLAEVRGGLAMAQILETSLLNHLTFPTLIATKASRIKESACCQLLMEFGVRRAQGWAANAGARAALIGGADFTSNVGISCVLGYPPKGTHAHSLVQVFLTLGGDELDAFRAFADIFPDECILLVDTLDTLESGVPNAIKVFEELRRKGHEPVGVRLDSGDLAYLSIKVAKMLDDAGFPDTFIVLSNQLDELVIWQITTQIQNEAQRYGVDPDKLIKRLSYGVGTSLITSKGASALDGVYKLVSVEDKGHWLPAMKISENREKTLNPGDKNVWRLYDQRNHATADLIGLEGEQPEQMQQIMLYHPIEPSKKRCLERAEVTEIEPLMEDIIVDGKVVYQSPTIDEMRAKRIADLERLDHGVKRLVNPHIYHVSLSDKLWQLKQDLIDSLLQLGDDHANP